MNRTLIQDFLLKYLEAVGQAAVETESGVYVATPEGGEPVELTFDPEAVAEKPSRELITFGSPLLETALARTLAAGRVVHLHAQAHPVDLALVEQRVRSRLTFDRVRLQGLEPGRMKEGRILTVHFLISIHGDVVQQLVCPVWIDGTSGRPADLYRSESGRLKLTSTRQFVLPLDTEARPELVAGAALDELGQQATVRLSELQAELALQQREEERRVHAYFRQREEEIESKRVRAKSPDLVSKTDQILAAVHAERDMRLRETLVRYRPRVEARVVAVEVLHVPRYVTSMVLQRGATTHRVCVRYEAILGSATLPECPSCGQPAESLIGQRDAEKLGCDRCARKPEPETPPAVVEPQADAHARPETLEVSAGSDPVRTDGSGRGAPGRSPSRRSRAPSAALSKRQPSEDFSGLMVSSDFWLTVVCTASKASRLAFSRCHRLSERLAYSLLDVFDRGFGEHTLTTRSDPHKKGQLLGHGLVTFLAESLLTPGQLSKSYTEELREKAQKRVFAGEMGRAHRLLACFGEPPRSSNTVQVQGVDYHIRAMISFRIGSSEALGRTFAPDNEMKDRISSTLRREFELTSGGDDVWLLQKTAQWNDCVSSMRRCLEYLQKLKPTPSLSPDSLRRQLFDAVSGLRSPKGRAWR